MKLLLPFLAVAAATVPLRADPQLTSWVTGSSTKYARIYQTDSDKLNGTTYTTWTNGRLTQSLPVYAGVQAISYSASWVYFSTSDLGPYVMGPWYNDASRTTAFVNLPVNQKVNYRIPRTSTLGTPPAAKSVTFGQEDAIGYFVDGVALFDPTDAFTYSNGTEASPGTGQWHRSAYANEKVTFDPGNTHQQNTGKYHNHANPLALRYLLGDHVDIDSSKLYSESTAGATKHSPILGWVRDGYPLYGPYGYASRLDASSGVRRMIGGFVLRDGTTPGVDNINTAGRALPAWATRNNGNVTAAGPAVSTTYPMARYCEDWAYLGDLTKPSTGAKYVQDVDFDLNEYNVRYCVTPEFPGGTWAYFINIDATGTPQFPYNTNYYFFGTPTGGTLTATETVTSYFKGGPNAQETLAVTGVDAASGDVTVAWSSLEGGTYKLEARTSLTGTWGTLLASQAAASNAVKTAVVDSRAQASNSARFYRVTRTGLASYDNGTTTTSTEGISSVSPTSGAHGAGATLTITLNSAYSMPPPPASVQPTAVTLTRSGASTVSASSFSRNTTTGIVTAVFSLPAGATLGAYTVNATFGPNTWSLTNGFTIN